jgi:dTDP-4-dehydrorhamnose 3,5-epimerase
MSQPEGATESTLAGVRWGDVTPHADERGSFTELWRASWFSALPTEATGVRDARFVQANRSRSATGVLRGLHFHRRQLDYWVVTTGRAFVALVDVRPLLAGAARPLVETRELGPNGTVTIPTGVAHGFLALDHLELVYVVTNEFDGSDELGFAWDDGDAAVPWPAVPSTPDRRPILSDRDRSNPSLRELVARLRDEGGPGPGPR